ncbi:MAG: hypothetical protein ACKV19_21860 [Verrucomicrobiales bacterium]
MKSVLVGLALILCQCGLATAGKSGKATLEVGFRYMDVDYEDNCLFSMPA